MAALALAPAQPVPVGLSGPEVAERFDAGRHVLRLLGAVDGTAELLRMIERVGRPQLEAAVFTADCVLRLHEISLEIG